jgi:hypothetical protein
LLSAAAVAEVGTGLEILEEEPVMAEAVAVNQILLIQPGKQAD